jgi:hypothetical protein
VASASAEVAAVGATLTDNDAMSVSESIPAPIQELWRQAVEHAEVAEDDLHLLAGTGDPMTDPRPSVHLKPGMELAYTEWREMFDQAGLDEANDPTYLHTHRIGLRCDCPWDTPLARAIALGLLRHEIEHALQYSGSDAEDLYALTDIADAVAQAEDGPAGNTYYRLMPTERGANAAAASLVCPRATPEVTRDLQAGNFAPFVTAQTAIPATAVPRLTVQYIYEHGGWEALVEDAYPGAGRWWRELANRAPDTHE